MKKTKLTSSSRLSEEWKTFNKLPDYLEISNFGRVRTIGRMIEYYNRLGNLVQYWAPSRPITVYPDQTEPKFRYAVKGGNHRTYNLFSELKEHFGDDWFFEHSWNGIHERRKSMNKKIEVVDGGSFREPDPEARNTVREIKIKIGATVDEKFKKLMEIAVETNDYNTRMKLLELCMEISKNGEA